MTNFLFKRLNMYVQNILKELELSGFCSGGVRNTVHDLQVNKNL